MRWIDRKIDNFIRRIRDDPRTLADQARWLAGDPEAPRDRIIPVGPGGAHNPTYWRYFVWPRNPVFNCYLHDFRRDDEQDPHDHRMLNITFILSGEYFEERFAYRPIEGYPLPHTVQTLVRERRPFVRLPTTAHRVVLKRDAKGNPVPIWSLFIGFPQLRNWGFWCPGKPRTPERSSQCHWIPQEVYLSSDGNKPEYNYSKPVRGCGD